MNNHLQRILPALVAAALAQSLLLAFGNGEPDKNILAAAACLGLVALPLAGHRRFSERTITMLLVTGALGGLGMLVGALIDTAQGTPLPCCTSDSAGGVTALFNWMNGLMIIACITGCWFLCPRCDDHHYELRSHFACAVSMCVGMAIGVRLLGDLWGAALGSGGVHLAMLAGMMGGVAVIEGQLAFLRSLRKGT